MKVDLIYFTFNRFDHTRITLPVLLEQSGYPFRLTIVDNGSTDGTTEYLRDVLLQFKPRIPINLILNQRNEGLSRPTNQFWKQSGADLVGKIDNDILVEPGWLKKLVHAHRQDARLAVIGGIHFPLDTIDTERIDHNVCECGSVRIIRQPHIGGNYVAKLPILREHGYLNESVDASGLRIGGWTGYQDKLTEAGYIIGYHYPFIIFKHLHNAPSRYFKDVRGMSKRKYIRWEKEDGKTLLYRKWEWPR